MLELDILSLDGTTAQLIQQNEIFQYVSDTNKIINLEVRKHCSLEIVQLIMNLFPQVEYLKIRMNRKEIIQIMRFLFSKTNRKTSHLSFLCIPKIPKICLRQLDVLFKSKTLVKNYCIKYINQDLYSWW